MQREKQTDDCISRQAVSSWLKQYGQDVLHGKYKFSLMYIWKNLMDLPSAQPYTDEEIQKMQDLEQAEIQKAYELGKLDAEPHWIPCSERLPEPRVAVLGYAPKFNNIFALYYDSMMGWMVWSPIRDDCFPNSQGEIVAWMPLPEPYGGEQE